MPLPARQGSEAAMLQAMFIEIRVLLVWLIYVSCSVGQRFCLPHLPRCMFRMKIETAIHVQVL